MLSKAKIKYIKSLHLKKNRVAENMFLVEGSKSVVEFIKSKFTTAIVYGTDLFWKQYENLLIKSNIQFELASELELVQAGTLSSNNTAIALIEIPEQQPSTLGASSWTIVLDGINDPGNLGTIIRVADWYGIDTVITSENSVDVYNPKVVNTTKGSLARVCVETANLPKLLKDFKGAIIGADMRGEDIHSFKHSGGGVLLMGSESHGISEDLKALLTTQITIPRLGGAESLNVAVATAIICDNIIGR